MDRQSSSGQFEVLGIPLENPHSKNLCFCNVIVNSLISLRKTKDLLTSRDNNHYILWALQRLMDDRATIKSTREIKDLVGQSHEIFKTDDQHCPSEFLESLLEVCAPLRQHFEMKVLKKWTCKKCGTESESDDLVTTFPLANLNGNSSGDLVMKNLRKTSTIFKRCYNPECQNVTSRDGVVGNKHKEVLEFDVTSNVLFVRANIMSHRGRESENNYEGVKMIKEIRPTNQIIIGNNIFKVRSVVVHDGPNLNEGHYTCYLKTVNDSWIYCNDSRVKSVPTPSSYGYLFFYEKCSNITPAIGSNLNVEPEVSMETQEESTVDDQSESQSENPDVSMESQTPVPAEVQQVSESENEDEVHCYVCKNPFKITSILHHINKSISE